jgi:hypothetical protein
MIEKLRMCCTLAPVAPVQKQRGTGIVPLCRTNRVEFGRIFAGGATQSVDSRDAASAATTRARVKPVATELRALAWRAGEQHRDVIAILGLERRMGVDVDHGDRRRVRSGDRLDRRSQHLVA